MQNSVSPHFYMHPDDAAALENLRQVPLFDQFTKAYVKLLPEKMLLDMALSSKLELGPQQLPEIYGLLPPVCETLGVAVPRMFLEMNPYPNAYTYGDSEIMLTLTSGLVECLSEAELRSVVGHECGHIACHHVLYHTMATLLENLGDSFFGFSGLVTAPLKYALLYWSRRSELSADRAGTVVMGGCDELVNVMIRLSCGPKAITGKVSVEKYIEQVKDYDSLAENSTWHKLIQAYNSLELDHPFPAVRARELKSWCASEDFEDLKRARNFGENCCKNCGEPFSPGWKFCRKCGAPL